MTFFLNIWNITFFHASLDVWSSHLLKVKTCISNNSFNYTKLIINYNWFDIRQCISMFSLIEEFSFNIVTNIDDIIANTNLIRIVRLILEENSFIKKACKRLYYWQLSALLIGSCLTHFVLHKKLLL